MQKTASINSPWKNFPENIIRFASQFENTDNEFERLIGFLLLDVGVENLLKTYVLDSNLEYEDKNTSTKGVIKKDILPKSITTLSFEKIRYHQLIEAARDAAASKVSDDEFKGVEIFHEIRNTIYHEARKTFPSKQDFHEYLTLAKSLLQKLLEIEWENPDQNQQESPISDSMFKFEQAMYTWSRSFEAREHFDNLQRDILVAIALYRPKYATRRFEEKLKELGQEYIDTLGSTPSASVHEFVETELIKKFKELTGTKIEHIKFISEACYDVTYLQFGVLLTVLGDDLNNELNHYVEYRIYSRGSVDKDKEITQADIEKYHEYHYWIEMMQERINSFIEEKASKS